MIWFQYISQQLDKGLSVCRVIVAEVRGSAPRGAGAEMFVTDENIAATIGGGQLEYEAIAIARKQLKTAKKTGFYRHWQHFALGPNLGQCCGGTVTLLFEAFDSSMREAMQQFQPHIGDAFFHHSDHHSLPIISDKLKGKSKAKPPIYNKAEQTLIMPAPSPQTDIYIYGAGHVGRALIDITASLALNRHWVDISADRFPKEIADDVNVIPASDMSIIARHASKISHKKAIHIVLTYSHRLDEDIVYAVLSENHFAELGLIGSKTKAARFSKSLRKRGIAYAELDRLTCPIGLPEIKGKSPAHVALSIAGQIAVWLEE